MFDFTNILNEVVETVKVDVVNSIQKSRTRGSHTGSGSATGDTIRAIETKSLTDGSQLLAPSYIDILETGRKPTRENAPASDPTLVERLKAWCVARGIDEGARFAIAKKIHKEGYPGSPGILTEPLSDVNVNKVLNSKLEKLTSIVSHDIALSLKI